VITLDGLARSPNALAPHYSRFRVADRLLLTGHSHQAWPDVARGAQLEAYDDAAQAVDGKWDRAFARADDVRTGFRHLLSDPGGDIARSAPARTTSSSGSCRLSTSRAAGGGW
jgi:kynureninase